LLSTAHFFETCGATHDERQLGLHGVHDPCPCPGCPAGAAAPCRGADRSRGGPCPTSSWSWPAFGRGGVRLLDDTVRRLVRVGAPAPHRRLLGGDRAVVRHLRLGNLGHLVHEGPGLRSDHRLPLVRQRFEPTRPPSVRVARPGDSMSLATRMAAVEPGCVTKTAHTPRVAAVSGAVGAGSVSGPPGPTRAPCRPRTWRHPSPGGRRNSWSSA